MGDPVLIGRTCVLRAWRRGDAASLVRYGNNPNVARQLRDRFPHPYTARDAQAFLGHVAREDPPANFAIDRGGEAVGGIGFHRGSDIERYSAEIGYWLAEEQWGRGITSEALALLTAHLFEDAGLLRLFAVPFADNAASIRVLEKAGFVREALLRAGSVKDGVVRDQLLFARVNDRWTPPAERPFGPP